MNTSPSNATSIQHQLTISQQRIEVLTSELEKQDFGKIEPMFRKHLINLRHIWEESQSLYTQTGDMTYDDQFT
jgi:hypothetical protein